MRLGDARRNSSIAVFPFIKTKMRDVGYIPHRMCLVFVLFVRACVVLFPVVSFFV